eukprot:627542_1
MASLIYPIPAFRQYTKFCKKSGWTSSSFSGASKTCKAADRCIVRKGIVGERAPLEVTVIFDESHSEFPVDFIFAEPLTFLYDTEIDALNFEKWRDLGDSALWVALCQAFTHFRCHITHALLPRPQRLVATALPQ